VGRATRWCRRNPTRFALLATTSLLLIAIMVGVMYRRQSVLSSRALQVAQALATSRQETAATAQFYRLLQEAKSLAARREPGWTWEVERLLTEAVELPSAVRDHDLLRGTLTEMLTHFDFRFRQTVAKGTLAGSLAFSPDGKYFALGDSIDETRPTIQVFSVTHLDSPQWTFAFHSEADTQRRIARGDAKVDNGIRALGFSPDGRWLAAGTRFGKVLVYDLQAPQAAPKRLEVLADQEVSKVGFSHDGRLLFALVSEQRLVQWEHFQQPVIIDADVRDFACNSRGDDLVVLYRDKIEVRASLDQSPEQMHNRIGEAIKDGGRCALAPDGRMLAVEYEDAISIFDMRTGWRVPRLLRDGGLQTAMAHRGLAFDGDRVIASGNETLRVWDPASGNLLYRLPASSRHIPIMALDPLGRFLAVRKGGPTEFYELRRPPHRRSMGGIMDRTRQAAIEDGVLVAAREAAWPSHRVRMMQWDCQTGRDLSEFLICDSSGADYPNAGSEAAAWGNRRAVTAYPLGLVVWENPPDKPLRVQTLNEIGKSVSLPLETLRDEQNQSVPPFPLAGGEPVLRIRPTQEPVVFRVQVPTESLPPQWTRLAVSVVVRWQRNQNGGDAIIGGYVDRPSVANAPPWTGDRRRWGIREFAGADAALVVLQRAERQRFTDDWDARLELPGADAPFDYVDIQQILVSPLPADEAGQAEDPALIDRITFAPDGQRLWGVISDEYLASWGLEDPGPPRRWTSRPEGLTHLYDIQIGQDRVYSAGRNGHVQLTDRGAGQWVTQLPVSSEPVGQIDLGPGEAWMIVSGDAGQVEKRGLPAGERLETIRAGREPVTAQALSPDAKWLALGDASGLCTLYRREATGFQRYVELGRYARPLNQLIFSRNGRYLAVISQHRLASDVFDLAGLQQAFAAYEADQ
jgi:WD40 repeat protein